MRHLFLITLCATVSVVGMSARATCVGPNNDICTSSPEEIQQMYQKYETQRADETEQLKAMRGDSAQHIYFHNGDKPEPKAAAAPKRSRATVNVQQPVFDESQPFEEVSPDSATEEEHTHPAPRDDGGGDAA